MTSTMTKGYRIIAKIYENERTFRSTPMKVWGYRFFDETGKRKVVDISVKDLVSTSKKDTFNALSVKCHHAHMTKTGSTLDIVFDDGNAEFLPCVAKDTGACLTTGVPIIYELYKKGEEIIGYGVVDVNGKTVKMTPNALKDYILKNLGGANVLMQGGTIKGFNLRVNTRASSKAMGSVHAVLTRSNTNYAFPEVVE